MADWMMVGRSDGWVDGVMGSWSVNGWLDGGMDG